eukprot:3928853-Heterocapsa_arctica.AAC.1
MPCLKSKTTSRTLGVHPWRMSYGSRQSGRDRKDSFQTNDWSHACRHAKGGMPMVTYPVDTII